MTDTSALHLHPQLDSCTNAPVCVCARGRERETGTIGDLQ